MVDYLYDGTFEGFLTCIYCHYYEKKASGIYRAENYQASILSDFQIVETAERKATTVYDAIEEKLAKLGANIRRVPS